MVTPLHQYELNLHNYYCGLPATQTWNDFQTWEKVLNERPQHDVIIELGTGWGGFALFLKHQAECRNIDFFTYDTNDWVGFQGQHPDRTLLGSSFLQWDILKKTGMVNYTISQFECPILFCDNGHKKEEVAIYAPKLPKGSLLVAHDWGIEIDYKDMPKDFITVKVGEYTRFFEKL